MLLVIIVWRHNFVLGSRHAFIIYNYIHYENFQFRIAYTMQKKKNGGEQGLGMKLYGTTHSFVGSSCSTLHFLTWYTSKVPVQESKASFLAWRWFTLVGGRKSKELLTQSIACCLSLWSIVWTSGVYTPHHNYTFHGLQARAACASRLQLQASLVPRPCMQSGNEEL